MRNSGVGKIMGLALAGGTLFAVLLLAAPQAHAVDIFIKKNKQEAPADGLSPPPKVFTSPKTAPSGIPPARAQQKPAKLVPPQSAKSDLPHSTPAKAVCSPEDARKILSIDARINANKNVSDNENSHARIRLKNVDEVSEVINLYLRCGAYLRQYKEASGKAPASRTPVRR